MTHKKVVICLAVYNAELTLRKTLDSLFKQTYPIYKIKIFNNASTDGTLMIAQEFSRKYHYVEIITHSQNIGGEGNFTACLKASEGDYTLIAHADDIYTPEFIRKSVITLERNPHAVASFTKAYEIDDKGKIIGTRIFPREISRNAIMAIDIENFFSIISLYGNIVTCPSVVCRSHIYREKIQHWNGQLFNTSADLDVWFRLLEEGPIVAINEPLIQYRVAEVSYSFRVAKKRIIRHDFFMVTDFYLEKYKHLVTKEMKDNFIFLELKDHAIRRLNIIRTNNPDYAFPSVVGLQFWLILKKMFHSFWHLKMGWSIFAIYFLCYFKKIKRKP